MKVSEIMTTNVACCRPEDSDDLAAQLMWDNDCGVLPVVDARGRTVGMVTDRDICMAAYTRGHALRDLPVADAMSHEVFGCSGQDSIEEALEVMRKHRVRRLPVLDPGDHLVGLLSMKDVVDTMGRRGVRKGRPSALLDAMLGTLSAICENRGASAGELVPRRRAQAAPRKGKPSVRK